MKIQEAENLWWFKNARRTSFVARSNNTESIDSLYNTVPPFLVSTSPQNGEIRRRLSPRGNGAGVYWPTATRNEITPFVFTWNHTQRKVKLEMKIILKSIIFWKPLISHAIIKTWFFTTCAGERFNITIHVLYHNQMTYSGVYESWDTSNRIISSANKVEFGALSKLYQYVGSPTMLEGRGSGCSVCTLQWIG